MKKAIDRESQVEETECEYLEIAETWASEMVREGQQAWR
jgi:hypothetical protein